MNMTARITGLIVILCSCLIVIVGWQLVQKIYFSKKESHAIAIPSIIEGEPVIQHMACIMDGNRRWAKKQGLVPWYGHKEGVESVRRAMEFCLEHHIRYLSLYTFSLENFRRSPEETKYLFELMVQQAQESIVEAQKNNIKLRFIGDRTKFPDNLISVIDRVEKETGNGHALTVNFLFCYGGQQEIVQAVKELATEVQKQIIKPEDITIESIKKHLWLNDVPDPEIIIRTGGVQRLSNFLLFQAAYSEFYFLDCLWPDITKKDFEKILADFAAIKRNFGT